MIDATPSGFLGHCRWCGVAVSTSSFRTLEDLRAYYTQAAACQSCRDLQEFGRAESDSSVPNRIRHGLVASVVCDADDCIREIAFLPFLFVVGRFPGGASPIVWDPRYIVRAGPAVDPVQPWIGDLSAMSCAWSNHFVRLLEVPFFTDPVLRAALDGRDLVIGLDFTSARAVATIVPNVRWPALVGLSEGPWNDAFGLPLLPLGPFLLATSLVDVVGTAEACLGSALRQLALIARLLELPATIGRSRSTAFEFLLSQHSARFGESFRGSDGEPS